MAQRRTGKGVRAHGRGRKHGRTAKRGRTLKDVSTAADVFLIRRGNVYKADPPRQRVHPATRNQLCIRNLTGSNVLLWFPENVLVGESPADVHTLLSGGQACFSVASEALGGVYPYAAYVMDDSEFVEGNTPPDIIIDK
jgi:hypothetical protein